MTPVVADIDQVSVAIAHATAPAFMLGAVAGFLSILIARLERIGDRARALRSSDLGRDDPSTTEAMVVSYARRMRLLSRAIFFAVLSAVMTAALLISAFVAALFGAAHARIVATMFAISLALLMAALLELAREVRIYMAGTLLDQ
jgi:hypothetical protein